MKLNRKILSIQERATHCAWIDPVRHITVFIFNAIGGHLTMDWSFLNGTLDVVAQFVWKYFFLFVLAFLSLIIIVFRHRIDYFLMKNDRVWRKWYKGVYRCPSCHKKLRPDDYPPNYICRKCGNTFSFGDKDVREWIRTKPLMTKGEFLRLLTLLIFLAAGATWLFASGVLAS